MITWIRKWPTGCGPICPKPRGGQNYHQWLTSQYGLKKLTEHLWLLIGIASTCYNIHELQTKMAERFGRQPVQYVLWIDMPRKSPPAAQEDFDEPNSH